MASWAEDQERGRRYDDLLDAEPGFRPDPKPAGRVKADLNEWERMREMLNQPCQVCGRDWISAEMGGVTYNIGRSLHHIVPRSQGGDDVPANLAVLCGHGTVGCHGDVEARRNDARRRLRLNMTDDQTRYVLEKKGDAWLDRHYPQSEATKGMESSNPC